MRIIYCTNDIEFWYSDWANLVAQLEPSATIIVGPGAHDLFVGLYFTTYGRVPRASEGIVDTIQTPAELRIRESVDEIICLGQPDIRAWRDIRVIYEIYGHTQNCEPIVYIHNGPRRYVQYTVESYVHAYRSKLAEAALAELQCLGFIVDENRSGLRDVSYTRVYHICNDTTKGSK